MNVAYLLTGGNIGHREEQLGRARELIGEQCGEIMNCSGIYETAAWGKRDQPLFLNQALELYTELDASQLIHRLLSVEKSMGRMRDEKYGPRLIDIDILLFNDEKYETAFLHIPHPELHNRRFALLPLAEIAGEVIHPVLGRSINELLLTCSDPLAVIKQS